MSIKLRNRFPTRLRLFFMRHIFGFVDESSRRYPRIVAHNRLVLSARYIRGIGIEVGGLGRPLKVSSDVTVHYTDRFSSEDLKKQYPTMDKKIIKEPDIVTNGETLEGVADESQDFVIANHVIEHFQNPLAFLKSAHRVLKHDGILFMAFPNKERTFDSDRPVTTFEHLIKDYTEGPEWSKQGHYEEFVEFAKLDIGKQSWTTEEEKKAQVQDLIDLDYSIHFHVWDIKAMFEVIMRAQDELDMNFEIECFLSSADEGIFILRKLATR